VAWDVKLRRKCAVAKIGIDQQPIAFYTDQYRKPAVIGGDAYLSLNNRRDKAL
jgi:hypothetical protein